MPKDYGQMTRPELIAEILRLAEEASRFESTKHELDVHREELRAQTEALIESQRLLEQSRDRYADLYDFAPLPYVTISSAGVIEEINLTGAKLLGTERPRILDTPFLSYVAPSQRSVWLNHMTLCRARRSSVVTSLSLTTRHGSTIPVQLVSAPFERSEGGFSYRTAITDLTERQHAEEEIRLLNAELEDRVQQRTGELQDAIKRLREEVAQRIAAEDQLKEYAQALESANQALQQASEAARLADRDKLECERVARSEAEKANQMKDEFLAILSHELRTPLNAMLGWTQLIRKGRLGPEETQRAIEIIERNARVQEQLVSDLLDMSRIISGKFRLELEGIELRTVIESALDTVRPAAAVKGVRLEAAIELRRGEILADPNRLQQVVWNLISNAIKFTPTGGRVNLRARRVNSDIEITVQDTGIGIKPEFLPHVFDRFRQADASLRRHEGGLGLGLAIVRHLVKAHGGAVHADSPGEGKGASFTVRLPARPATPGESQALSSAHTAAADPQPDLLRVRELRILVVDDDPDARTLIQRQLEGLQAVVALAESTQEAVREFTTFRPDLLVCDIGMPVKDGYELIREIRALERDRHKTPAIALTAFARPEDRDQAMEAGFQLHLTKPVDSAALVQAVASMAQRAIAARPSRRPRERGGMTLRLLLVEDNEDTALYIVTALEQQGHEVTVASAGPSALTIALDFRPHAVLLDIGLPGMDGYEVARRLRQTKGLENTLVAAVSGYMADPAREDDGLFDYYVNKPISPEKLYALIDDLRLRAAR
jgi:PAS domain S-box-containing protein